MAQSANSPVQTLSTKIVVSNSSSLLMNSLAEQQAVETLLNKCMPNYRQAYSDRTAWLMACISELAYLKFNPLFKSTSKQYFINQVAKLVDDKNIKSLDILIDAVAYDPKEEEQKLRDNSEILNLTLVKTFDNNGSQAILLENDQHIFLGFRGTEPTSIKDLKADAKATTAGCESGGKIHTGFNDAFNDIAIDIQNALNEARFHQKPLFITGHSLGGALATVATKKLKHSAGIAACYTYGSPRVGDMDWTTGIKTPIYRVVNAADPVTMLPPSSETISLFAWASGFIPYAGNVIKRTLLSKFGGYYHIGDMRYLSNCPQADYSKVNLHYGVSFFFRVKAFLIKKMSFAKVPGDHSITVYRKKLLVVATKRNA